MPPTPSRPRSTLLTVLLLWVALYASFTLFTPALLDDADSVHAEVAREMLLRHDAVTLYANGIRYLEKAPLLYWSMAASMKVFVLFGANSPRMLAAAARLPLAFSVLALALMCEAFARRLFRQTRAGLYAALILLSGFGIFIFSRITIPDVMVCLWLTVALYAFWRTEEDDAAPTRTWPLLFAAACALNVLTKGLIGLVFPVAIVVIYLLLTRGLTGTLRRLRELHPLTSLFVFLAIAAPWHIVAGLANPTQGHPETLHYINGHWLVPLPTDGNVRGWFWFYFMNEHVLRYLNLRVPRDYDTSPLWLFWGLCLVWLMPWSAFVFHAAWQPLHQWLAAMRVRLTAPKRFQQLYTPELRNGRFMLLVAAAFVLLFFSLSTRQEYYVLPALPALAVLIAGWLAERAITKPEAQTYRRSFRRCVFVLFGFGSVFAAASFWFLLHTRAPAPNTDLAQLLAQNPGDYALSMGHFLDLNAQALGLFRLPLGLAALSLFLGSVAALLLSKGQDSIHPVRMVFTLTCARLTPQLYKTWAGRKRRFRTAVFALAAGAFGFLIAAHIGLRTFAPVLTSAQLAQAIAPQVQPQDLIVLHGEYEAGSTLGFYLQRPASYAPQPNAAQFIHILEGRSSNLWYGSYFPDAPPIFETPASIAAKWSGPQRIFMWQSTTDEPRNLPALPGPVYVLAQSGGKEIVSNQPNR